VIPAPPTLTPVTDLLRFGRVRTSPVVDRFGRVFRYLRISVTDVCNLRCVYCMPDEGVEWLPRHELLSVDELITVAEAAASAGVHKIRLTGGEPLARPGIVEIVRQLARIEGIRDLALTTNGTRLAPLAQSLHAAGLQRINISLDTLRADRFAAIARRSRLQDVLDGIHAARVAGLRPLKLNMVVLGGLNDDEVADFAAFTLENEIEVRFIEYMPLGETDHCGTLGGTFHFVSNEIVKARITGRFGTLQPVAVGAQARGPADVFQLRGAVGTLGFISAMSAPFCQRCDRLRLTADGMLRSCLLDGGGLDVRQLLRRGAERDELLRAFQDAADAKPEVHADWAGITPAPMSRIGG